MKIIERNGKELKRKIRKRKKKKEKEEKRETIKKPKLEITIEATL